MKVVAERQVSDIEGVVACFFFVKGGVRTKIGKELLAKRHAWIGSFRGKGIVDVEKNKAKESKISSRGRKQ